jgi:G protein-coupled receptor GPR1
MIAIHSALYIFQPGGSRREGGLYPYRHIVYTLWVMFPITMAGLGFINGNGPGVDPSTNCYLPIRPFWYRLVLSWVPRYIIFLSIMGIYVSIYFFVRKKFHGFDKEGKSRTERLNSPPNGNRGSKRQKRHCIPSTPTLTCHGLIPQASRQNPVATDADVVAEARKKSASTSDFDQSSLLFKTGTTRFIWESIFTNNRSSEEAPPSDDLYTIDSNSFTGPVTPRPLPAYLGPSPPTPNDVEFVNPSQFRVTSWRAEFVSRVTFSPSHSPASKRSTADIFSILRRGPPDMSTETQTPISQLHLVTSRGQNLPASAMLRTREKIRRQLRLSFVYPLVYMGMWILPFVADVLLFEDPMTISPPFALGCAAAIFGCSQAAVDSWLFFTREKPWKHIHETDGSFWGSLKFWSGWNGVRRKRRKREPGKTRDEMVRDSRAAYHRREEELAQRRLVAVQGAQSGGDRRDRSWWEAEGLDGPIETVQEESADPDEDVESNSRQSSDDETDLPSPEASEEKDEIKEEPLIWPAHTINAKDELSTENGQEG